MDWSEFVVKTINAIPAATRVYAHWEMGVDQYQDLAEFMETLDQPPWSGMSWAGYPIRILDKAPEMPVLIPDVG